MSRCLRNLKLCKLDPSFQKSQKIHGTAKDFIKRPCCTMLICTRAWPPVWTRACNCFKLWASPRSTTDTNFTWDHPKWTRITISSSCCSLRWERKILLKPTIHNLAVVQVQVAKKNCHQSKVHWKVQVLRQRQLDWTIVIGLFRINLNETKASWY